MENQEKKQDEQNLDVVENIEQPVFGNADVKQPESSSQKEVSVQDNPEKAQNEVFVQDNPANIQKEANSEFSNVSSHTKKKKNKKVVIISVAAACVLIIGAIVAYIYYNEYSDAGKYNKAIKIYNELCQYQTSDDKKASFIIDDDCIDRINDAKDRFKEIEDYQDAKVYYYGFNIASNIYRMTKGNNAKDTYPYFQQIVDDTLYCRKNNIVPDKDVFTPENESQKFYVFITAYFYHMMGLLSKSSDTCDRAHNMYNEVEKLNNGSYTFCGKESSQLNRGLDLLSMSMM